MQKSWKSVKREKIRETSKKMIIEQIDEKSPYLNRVKDLGRRNSKTLGFFPEGAFEDHASKGGVLIARSKKDDAFGYLLYRIVWRWGAWPVAVIVHLCVDNKYRNKGIAKTLVNKLINIGKNNFLRLELKCRRDYDANKIWEKIGFVYKGETLGRGGQPILRWAMDLRQLPLMALLEQRTSDKNFRAVLDANVIYRLQDPLPTDNKDKLLSEEAKSLMEDWLVEDVALLITDETFNELQRNDDPAERKRRLKYADKFSKLSVDYSIINELSNRLISHFSVNLKESARSDIKQLSFAIAGGGHFFITQDRGILKKGKKIHDCFGIRVLSPGEFIRHIDEFLREAEYRPNRLAGSQALKINNVRVDQIPLLFPVFHSSRIEEKISQFESKLRKFIAQPQKFDVEVCIANLTPLALIVCDRSDPSVINIPMLRVSRSPLSETILRYLLRRAVLNSARENRLFVQVTNTQDQLDFEQALEECGFTKIGDQWVKCNLQLADNSFIFIDRLVELSNRYPKFTPLFNKLITELSRAIREHDCFTLSDLERRLWPIKILDADIPTYIISIESVWAQHLFDEVIARQKLWGSREDLALRNENVYYRSKRPSGNIRSPARILWYVKYDKNLPKLSKQVRACSALDEVIIGRPKELFRAFQRLGVYEWKDVLRTANNNIDNQIMALRFSNTILLPHPIDLVTLQHILFEEEGKNPILQSPQYIRPQSFTRIYQAALLNQRNGDDRR